MPQTPLEQLGYLGFQVIPPGLLLRPYVKEYWSLKRSAPLAGYHEESMHPNGGFGIVFNFGDPVCLDHRIVADPVFLDGTNTQTRKMGFVGNIELVGVCFCAGAASPFLRLPLIELQNELEILATQQKQLLLDVHAIANEATTLAARIGIIESWLIKRLADASSFSPLITTSLAVLRSTVLVLPQEGKRTLISTLADDLAISQRQLEHLYRNHVGMTPIEYVRLQRVERARLALRQQKQSNARLAADLGYYDQAHFIRDFSSVIGITPYAYMNRKHAASTQ